MQKGMSRKRAALAANTDSTLETEAREIGVGDGSGDGGQTKRIHQNNRSSRGAFEGCWERGRAFNLDRQQRAPETGLAEPWSLCVVAAAGEQHTAARCGLKNHSFDSFSKSSQFSHQARSFGIVPSSFYLCEALPQVFLEQELIGHTQRSSAAISTLGAICPKVHVNKPAQSSWESRPAFTISDGTS